MVSHIPFLIHGSAYLIYKFTALLNTPLMQASDQSYTQCEVIARCLPNPHTNTRSIGFHFGSFTTALAVYHN